MLMRIFITLFCLMFSFHLGAEIYRSVDEAGNVIFTDKPSADAKLIEVDELQTIKPPPVGKFKYTPPPVKRAEKYTEINITSPVHDIAIRDNGGNVTVNIATTPGVRGGDNLYLYLDGKEILLGRATAKAFTGLDRGTHQLRTVIKDGDGRILLSSTSVSFHLLRASVN